ncbi:methyltransferase domain-containing protein [Motilibacter deserti]|uniref:Methyltransferase domain-containing protein n=1 Tax=Motilibacter deserti TaxID=2714956 RepID=A0ABX0GS72_9ACTN|nr:methyltransferase domain-containing protein [Motilibacter deserti]NHC12615.1 methyltransferase domain-containing protein [Motilibacter deserti]
MSLREAIRDRTPLAALELVRRTKHKSVGLRLRGDDVECPACHGRFSRLLPDAGGRLVVCPRCGTLERHRRMILFLRTRTDIGRSPLRVLHVAPEPSIRRELQGLGNLDYVTGDLFVEDVDVRLDVTDIQFKDAVFDVVICSHVLEHVDDDRAAMRELRRVLKPDGWALVDVPCDPSLPAVYEDPTITDPAQRLEHFGQEDHVRCYDVREFLERMRDAGFEVTEDPLEATPEQARRYVLGDGTALERSFLARPVPTA